MIVTLTCSGLIPVFFYFLKRMPEVNSIWNGEDSDPLMTVDIAVAVATENGLITPIVRSADEKGVLEISNNIKVSRIIRDNDSYDIHIPLYTWTT